MSPRATQGTTAIRESGIVPEHAQAFQNLCKELGWFVIFRGVNPDATPLIRDNYPTKDMGVHGKSSNWGPQAGFICLNQFFSKVVKDGEDKVRGANSESPLSLAHGYPAVPLLVSKASLQSLLQRKKLEAYNEAEGWVKAKVPNQGVEHTFQLRPVTDGNIKEVAAAMAALKFTLPKSTETVTNPLKTEAQLRGYLNNALGTISSLAPPAGKKGFEHLYFVKTDTERAAYPHWYKGPWGEFLFVLASTGEGRFSREVAREGVSGGANPPTGQDTGSFSLPLTADYDIFAICPPLAHMEPVFADTDQGKAEREKWGQRKVGQRMLDRLGQIRKLKLTEDWGAVTPYHLYGLLRLNEAAKKAGYRGGFVCHHGTEQENVFYAEVDEVYTVFTPSGRVHAVPPQLIEFFLTEIDLLEHAFYTNPSYVQQREARFGEQTFGKRTTTTPEGKPAVEKVRVDSLDTHGALVSKEVDAIFYYSRHRERLFNHLLEKGKKDTLIENLFEELANTRPAHSPLEGFHPLVDKWMGLMARTAAHHAPKPAGDGKPKMSLAALGRTKRFAQQMQRRAMTLPQLMSLKLTQDTADTWTQEDRELYGFKLWVMGDTQRFVILQKLLDESRFSQK